MELSSFRRRLLNGEVHLKRREELIKEYEYFKSISPHSPFEKIRLSRFGKLPPDKKAVYFMVFLLLMPIWLPLFPVTIIVLCLIIAFSRRDESQEYKDYNYMKKIAEPALRLFDEGLSMQSFHDSDDLVDTGVYYSQALVDAYLIMPTRKNSTYDYLSCGSYKWKDSLSPDSFDFCGYKVYYEWEDEDGDKHVETYFDGCIYKFYTSFTINGTVNIMSTTTKKTLLGGEKEKNYFKDIKDRKLVVIDTENQAFAEQFDTIATYDEEAYRYLTPSMIENLLEIRKDYFISICIKGNVMTVTIANGGYKNATPNSFGDTTKPMYASDDAVNEIDSRTEKIRAALISIYELKDKICP